MWDLTTEWRARILKGRDKERIGVRHELGTWKFVWPEVAAVFGSVKDEKGNGPQNPRKLAFLAFDETAIEEVKFPIKRLVNEEPRTVSWVRQMTKIQIMMVDIEWYWGGRTVEHEYDGQEKRLAMAAALIREALNTTWLLLWGRISKERWLSAINDDLRRGRSRVMKWALNKARRMAVGWVTWVKLREFEQKTPPRTKDSTACTFAVSERGAAAISVLETLSAAPSRKMSGIRQSLVIVDLRQFPSFQKRSGIFISQRCGVQTMPTDLEENFRRNLPDSSLTGAIM
ncbi:hypothetical protein K443DRAFT_637844 [Laccaria amethystina LaAM-08-1]|uniref:Uncharacterized protein n=1 Tax=Laccaria amethystina LaAM-08-1 TaxID=1095629 RepID=A0A0C9XDG2_9AGAR|nr:hypothetical protein K443DRAFT_637844 [Laccaria amethystina LaAM-08-1]